MRLGKNYIIEKCTSSGLVKTVADNKKAYIVSPEVFEVLNKLLKSEEKNATGDVQVLCQLFSGKSSSYRFTTEKTREIPANVPFSILGSTQVPYAARLLCRMDQGHGLLDRFIFLFPVYLRPSTTETEAAHIWLQSDTVPLKQVSDIFLAMHDVHCTPSQSSYTFLAEGEEKLKGLKDEFIIEVNDAIKEGNVPLKSKKFTCLHVFNHVMAELLEGRQPTRPPREIALETLHRAQRFMEFAETQKEIVMEVIFHVILNQ